MKSSFQTALHLMLMVAVPFFVVMIALYLAFAFGGSWSSSEKCDALCCYLANKTVNIYDKRNREYMEYEFTPEALNKRSISFLSKTFTLTKRKESENPAIAALLGKRYFDAEESFFKCAVGVIARNWALAVDDCFENLDFLRLESSWWSFGGVTKRINNVIFSNFGLVLLHFNFNSTNDNAFEIAKLDRSAQSFTWDGRIDLPLAQRQKFNKLISFEVHVYQHEDCSGFIKQKHISCYISSRNDFCGKRVNAPMVDQTNSLVGMHLETFCPKDQSYAIIFYIDVYSYKTWILNMINKF